MSTVMSTAMSTAMSTVTVQTQHSGRDTHPHCPQTQLLEDELVRLQEENRLHREDTREVNGKLRELEQENVDLKKSEGKLRRELTRSKWEGHSNRSNMERRERWLLRSETAVEQKSEDLEIRELQLVRKEAESAEAAEVVDDLIGKRWKLYETIQSQKEELDESRRHARESVQAQNVQSSRIGQLETEIDRLLLVTDELDDRLADALDAGDERVVSLRDVEPTEDGYPGRVKLCHMKLQSRGMSAAMTKECVQTVLECYAESDIQGAKLPSPSTSARWRMGTRRLSRIGASRDVDTMKETIFLSDMTTKGGNKVNSAHIMSPPDKDGHTPLDSFRYSVSNLYFSSFLVPDLPHTAQL
jgi:hypothetical protein